MRVEQKLMKQKKKSPIKDKPLRYVGQSLDERIDKLLNEDALKYLVICIIIIFWAANEWWLYFKNPPPSPKIITFIAVVCVFISVYKMKNI
jgi:hypothetical protein